MSVYHSLKEDTGEIMDDVIKFLEKETKKRVFTVRLMSEVKNGFDAIIVFDDKTVMLGQILLDFVDKKLRVNVRGDYV